MAASAAGRSQEYGALIAPGGPRGGTGRGRRGAASGSEYGALPSSARSQEPAGPGRSRVGRLTATTAGDLPVIEFAFPGPLRDQLVGAILTGEKTMTTGLLADYERENEPLPTPGLRQAVIDSVDRPVAVIETTAVRVMRLAEVDLGHAQGEGGGYASVTEWRAGMSSSGIRPRCARSLVIPLSRSTTTPLS